MMVRRLFVTLVASAVSLTAQEALPSAPPIGVQAALRTESTPAQAAPVRPPVDTVPVTPQAPAAPNTTATGATRSGTAAAPPAEFQVKPSWETQKLARTYIFTIPAPRGLITDRHGTPLAQTRIGYNLALQFPTPPEFSDTEANRFISDRIAAAAKILGREISPETDAWLKHYKNRGIMPLVILQDLKEEEVQAVQRAKVPGLILQPVYLRFYPQGTSAAHIRFASASTTATCHAESARMYAMRRSRRS